MTPTRIALIGAGLIGKEHLRFAAEEKDCQIVAIADPSPHAASIAAAATARYFTDHVRMLEVVKPDAAIVAVPNRLHESIALACVQRRIPILLEKPVADTLSGAARITDASEAADIPVLIGHHRRHSPDMKTARQLVRTGELGAMVAVNGMWLAKKPEEYFQADWRRQPGGGLFLINLIHEIDCLRYMLGDVESIQVTAANSVRHFAVEDTAALIVQFTSGALGTFVISDAVPSPWFWDVASGQGAYFPYEQGNCFFLGGTRASLAVPSMQLRWHAGEESWQDPILSKTVSIDRSSCYLNQLRHFIAVARRETEPLCSAREGMLTLATTLAAAEAAVTATRVQVHNLIPHAAPLTEGEAI